MDCAWGERMKADLHIHTTASDGQYTPSEVAELAQKAGLECIAITDHDTVDGAEEAVAAGEKAGLRVIRGVELGAREYKNLHILGYGYSPDAPVLRELCQKMKESRDERKYRIIRFLKEKGICISLEEVEEIAGGNIIARPHFAQALVRRGYVQSTREAFDLYLDTDEYQRIERFKVGAAACIAVIRQAGGKAVMAHPYQVNLPDGQLEALVCELKQQGLEGLECYYPKHTENQVKFYLHLAEKYELHITAGSDFHGEKAKPDISLKPVDLDLSWLM